VHFRRCLAVLFGAVVLGVPCQAGADAIVIAPFSPPSDFVVEVTFVVSGTEAGPAGSVLNPFGTGYTVTVTIQGDTTSYTFTPNAPTKPLVDFGALFQGLPQPPPKNSIPGLSPQSVQLDFQGGGQPLALPGTGVSDQATGGPDFLVLYTQESLQGGASAGEWYELPFNPTHGEITVGNNESNPITLSNVGYLISSTEIPLDQLNATDLPPSSFLSLPSLDGAVIPGGGIINATVVPEPPTLVLCALGSVGLVRRRRREPPG
jgi:hypothetical protein